MYTSVKGVNLVIFLVSVVGTGFGRAVTQTEPYFATTYAKDTVGLINVDNHLFIIISDH